MVAAMLRERPRMRPTERQREQARTKRLLDIAFGIVLFAAALPIIAIAALCVAVVDRHAPFYADTRIGRRGRPFRCLKLRTMRADPRILEQYLASNPHETEAYRVTRKLKFDPRVTPLGGFFRRTSIDELPQILNVLRGEMAIVGPRPLAPGEFLERGVRALPLTLVRPGVTGLWQVRGRSDTSFRRRIALDNYYARKWSLGLDLRIIAATPLAVFTADGAR